MSRIKAFKEQIISEPTPTKLQKLWLEDNHCRCCGKRTRLLITNGGKLPADMATIEHVYPIGHPLRVHLKHIQTLYCNGCNSESNYHFKRTGELYSYWKSSDYRFLMTRIAGARNSERIHIVPRKRALIPLEMPNTVGTQRRESLPVRQGKSERIEGLWSTMSTLLSQAKGLGLGFFKFLKHETITGTR